MRNDNIAELLIDLDNLEVHGLVNKLIVILDRPDVDLGAREERLDAEHVHDHTALCAGLHVSLYNLALVECLVDHIPGTELTSLLVRKNELSFLVLRGLNVNLNLVTCLELRVVTEFRSGNDAFALVTDVHEDFPLVDSCNCTFDNLTRLDLGESLVVSCLDGGLVYVTIGRLLLKCVPVELLRSN